jgi:hypothetical protein
MLDTNGLPGGLECAIALMLAVVAPFVARALGDLLERRARSRTAAILSSLGSNKHAARPTYEPE